MMFFIKIELIPLSEHIKVQLQISTFLSNNKFVWKAFNESQILQLNWLAQLKFHRLIIVFFSLFFKGNFNGTLSKVPASDLGAVVVKEVLKRANTNAADVNEVIIGQVNIVSSFFNWIIKLFVLKPVFVLELKEEM